MLDDSEAARCNGTDPAGSGDETAMRFTDTVDCAGLAWFQGANDSVGHMDRLENLENIPNPSADKTWIAQLHSYSPHCFSHLQSPRTPQEMAERTNQRKPTQHATPGSVQSWITNIGC